MNDESTQLGAHGDNANRPGFSRRRFLQGMGLGATALAGVPFLDTRRFMAPRVASEAKSVAPLRVGVVGDVDTFSPFELSHTNYIFIANIFDTLIRYDENLKPMPRLAESWSVARNQESITIKLRPDARFQNGDRVTAQAVVANFNWIKNPTTGLNLYSFAEYIKQAVALGSTEVRIEFTQPLPTQAITDVAMLTSVVEPSVLQSLATKAVGAGPFRFDSWIPNTKLTMSKFANFWNKPLPAISNVNWRMYADEVSMVEALQSDGLDVAAYVAFADAASLKGKFNIVSSPTPPQVYEVRVNPTKPPFTNVEARRGLQHAIDREGIVKTVLWGLSEPTVLPFGKTSPAYDATAIKKYPFSLSRAQEQFSAAGASGWSAEILVTSAYPETVTMAELLASDLTKIGCTLTIDQEDLTTYDTRLASGDFQLCASYSGVGNEYPLWITTSGDFRVVDNNLWGSNVPSTYVTAMKNVSTATTPALQKAALAELRNVLLSESWVIDIAFNPSLTAVSKKLTGVTYTTNDWLVLENARWSS